MNTLCVAPWPLLRAQASDCTPCATGRFSPQKSTACDICAPGTADTVRRAHNLGDNRAFYIHSFNTAFKCNALLLQDKKASTPCVTCPKGKYAPGATTLCEECTPGRADLVQTG